MFNKRLCLMEKQSFKMLYVIHSNMQKFTEWMANYTHSVTSKLNSS